MSNELPQINATKTIEVIKSFHAIKRTACFEAQPGVGKTSVVKQAAEQLGIPCIIVHLPTTLPEDFGIPNIGNNNNSETSDVSYSLPYWFPYEGKEGLEEEGILCFDDRNQANGDIQKIIANIMQERVLHGKPLAKGWSVFSTGNRREDRAGANKIYSHLRNRETVFNFDVTPKEWIKWAVANDVRQEVIGFIAYDNQWLSSNWDADNEINPTPRSWTEGVSSVMKNVDEKYYNFVIPGAVGIEAYQAFKSFLDVYIKLPSIEEILKDPLGARIPKSKMEKSALVSMLAHKVADDNIDNLCKYVDRFEESELLMVYYTVVVRQENNKYMNHPNVDKFIADHGEWFM